MLSARPAILRIVILAAVAVADISGIASVARLYASQRDAPVYAFIGTELPADAVILGDERVWLFTGRRAVGMPAPMEYFYLKRPDPEMEFFMSYKDVARQFGARYVLHEPWDGVRGDIPFERKEQLATAIRSDPGLERIFSRDGVELFRIRTNGPGLP